MSETGQQVPLLEGSGASAASQRQELGSKDFTCPSVDHALHHPEGSPETHADEDAGVSADSESSAATEVDSPSDFLLHVIHGEQLPSFAEFHLSLLRLQRA